MSDQARLKIDLQPDVNEANWTRWVMQTARSWNDISGIINKTGIDSIDNDHKQMTEVVLEINNLIDIYESGEVDLQSIQEQGRVLETLYSFAERHFDREIGIIQKYNLPGFDEQQKQHKLFLEMLTQYMADFREGRLAVSLNLKSAVLEWWVRHINTIDTRTFSRENWTQAAIDNAHSWDDVAEIIRPMGNELLDLEHREMTEVALGLMAFVHEDKPDFQAVDQVFENLIRCAEKHFHHEEGFIQMYELPDLDKQQKQHDAFMAMLADYRSSVQNGTRAVDRALQSSILRWWVNHINVVDYNAFSLDKHGDKILGAAKSCAQAMQFVHRTGNDVVDDDHQNITAHIIEIDRLIEQEDQASPQEAASLGQAFFQEMLDLCVAHFRHEEEQMLRDDYAGYRMHKEQHDRFLVSMERHKEDFASGRAVASRQMKHFILEWWVEHIKEFDMRAFGGRAETASAWDVMGRNGNWGGADPS